MRLLKLDPVVQTGMRDGFLSMGHGRALINVEESEKQLEIYEKIIASLPFSKRDRIVGSESQKKGQSAATTKAPQPLFYDDAVEELKSYFNTSVTIKGNDKEKETFKSRLILKKTSTKSSKKSNVKTKVFIPILILLNLQVFAQQLPKEEQKTRKQRLIESPLTPSQAAFYSAILPGLGQIYIGKAWKVPFVYAAIGASVYGYVYNPKRTRPL